MTIEPPRFAERLLDIVARVTAGDASLTGDLREEFAERMMRDGEPRAIRWYTGQALLLCLACVRVAVEVRLGRTWRWATRRLADERRGAVNAVPHSMDALRHDLRFSARLLRTRPHMSAVTILTIAAAIAVASTIVTVVDSVMIRPLPFPQSDRVVRLGTVFGNGSFFAVIPYLDARDFRRDAKSFSAVSAFSTWQATLAFGDRPDVVRGVSADSDFARVLSLRVQRGRAFEASDFVSGGPQVALITDQLWQSRFGGDHGVVGRIVMIDERPRTIVGIVEPRAFNYPAADLGVITPLRVRPNSGQTNRACRCFNSIAQLSPGTSVEQARNELRTIQARIDTELGNARVRGELRIEPLRDAVVGPTRDMLTLLAAMVAIVLLVACVNVANLLLGQSHARTREFAVRAAIGGTRARIARQLATESTVIALAGSLIGTALVPLLSRSLIRLYPGGMPRENEISFSLRVLLVSCVLTVTAAFLASGPTIRQVRRLSFNETLRSGAGGGSSRGRRRVSAMLVTGQIALSVVLLFASGLLLQTFRNVSHVNPGFEARGLLTFRVDLPTIRYPFAGSVTRFLDEASGAIGALPGVRGAAYTSYLPFGGGLFLDDFIREEIGDLKGDNPKAAVAMISPGYEQVMGAPVLRGRGFRQSDDSGGAPVAIISEALARAVYAGADPVGRTIAWAGRPHRTIVGVMSAMRSQTLSQEPAPELFIPAAQEPRWSYYLTVRFDAGAPEQLTSIRAAVRAIDPAIALSEIVTMDERLASARAPQRFRAVLIAALGVIALILAVIGIYGVMANAVSQRAREIGIRMALGEGAERVRLRIAADAMSIAIGGAAVGAMGALAAGRWLESFVIGVNPWNATTLGAAVALLLVAALAAVYVPARRASRIDPMSALRME